MLLHICMQIVTVQIILSIHGNLGSNHGRANITSLHLKRTPCLRMPQESYIQTLPHCDFVTKLLFWGGLLNTVHGGRHRLFQEICGCFFCLVFDYGFTTLANNLFYRPLLNTS